MIKERKSMVSIMCQQQSGHISYPIEKEGKKTHIWPQRAVYQKYKGKKIG
jgi:hypothetical protein